ncbi:Calx-beta domain-containing protein [Aquimarina sp. SS2-1]|uniref:DUF7507 domain-containing protein n=1 Tax=Aquimarina besae TaxID=3342247 RepID=UPI003672AC65
MKKNTQIFLWSSCVLARILFFSFLFFIFSFSASSQTNISGVINSYESVVSITDGGCADPCDTSPACLDQVTVANASEFSVGDKILIVQLKGAVIDRSNTATAGQITDIGNAGNYEFFNIESISGNIITPSAPLLKSYDTAGLVQLVRVPVFPGDVNIVGDLQATPYDETTNEGGIVALFVEGTLTFNAGINARGAGYNGVAMTTNGSVDNCGTDPTTQYTLPQTDDSSFFKGGGVADSDVTNNKGRGPLGNGGGSGVSGDSGGGGGANYGAGGIGGSRWCDEDPANNPPNDPDDGVYTVAGGLGGYALDTQYNDNRVFFGGAGGPGYVTTGNPSQASNGGGIVVIRAIEIVGNNQTINASGEDAILISPTGAPDGGGGGGAGGSVAFDVKNYSGDLDIDVSGGNGQSLDTNNYHGPGGGGGGGVFLHNLQTLPSNLNVIIDGGTAGTHTNGVTNGAGPGQQGGIIPYYNFVETSNQDGGVNGDGINDFCDIDDDNDGILDVIEAGGNEPSADEDGDSIPNWMDAVDNGNGGDGSTTDYTDANGDGIPDVYDFDGDGVPNHLDLDSDNDGIFDLEESGQLSNGATDANNDGRTDGPFGDNGLDNSLDITGGDDDVNATTTDPVNTSNSGNPDYLSSDSDLDGCFDAIEGGGNFLFSDLTVDNNLANNASDVDSEGVPTVSGSPQSNDPAVTDRSINPCNSGDSDGDNVSDADDLDDDNDGILDTDELNCATTPRTLNQTFSSTANPFTQPDVYPFDVSGTTSTVNASFTASLQGGATWASGVSNVNGTVGVTDFVNLQANNTNFTAGDTYNFTLTFSETVYDVVFKWGGLDNSDRSDFFATSDGSQPIALSVVNDNGAGKTINGNSVVSSAGGANAPQNSVLVSIPGPVRTITIISAKQTINAGNVTLQFYDLIYCVAVNSDADGNPDHLDTDSDGDGCFDAIEGSGTFTSTDVDGDGELNGGVGANGVPSISGSPQTTTSAVTDSGDTSACDIDISAVDDVGTAVVEGVGGQAVANVLVNDDFEGATPTTATIDLTLVSSDDPGITLDTATGSVDVAGTVSPGTYSLTYQICPSGSTSFCDTAVVTITVLKDTDGDTVPDTTDLDDDNDGILDTDEDNCTIAQIEWSHNGAGGQSDDATFTAGSSTYYTSSQPATFGAGLDEATDDYAFTYLIRGADTGNFVDAKAANDYLELAFTPSEDLFLDGISLGFFTAANTDPEFNAGNFKMAVEVSDTPGFLNPVVLFPNIQVGDMLAPNGYLTIDNLLEGFLLTGNTQYTFRFYFFDEQNADPFNRVRFDDVQFPSRVASTCDFDGDGIVNSLDTDSDNDGCSDANEAYNDANADGGDGGQFGTVDPATVNLSNGLVTETGVDYALGSNANVTDSGRNVCTAPTPVILHQGPACDDTVYNLIWDAFAPNGTDEFDWTPDGALTNTFNDVDGSGVDITYTFSGETGTLGTWPTTGSTQSPSVDSNASGNLAAEVLEFFTSGFGATGITQTITFNTNIYSIGFDLYHINANGSGSGDLFTITATDGAGNTIFPTFTNSATPSYTSNEVNGQIDATGSSVANDNDQIGVNFVDLDGIASITIVWQNCSTCNTGSQHGSAIGGFDFCTDIPPVVVAGVSSPTVTEGSDLVHTVTLSGITQQPVTYPFVLADGSAVAPGDYTNTPVFSNGVTFDSVNGTITVPAGVTDFTVTYPTVTDALDEGDETTTLTVGGESGTGTIQDPADPTVASVSSETVTEGTDLVHTVTLSGSTPQPVTYPFVLADGSAVAPGDYTNTPVFSNGVTFDSVNGTITVPAGVTDFTVTYPTVTDALDEGDETTTLTVGGESGTGTIQDPADPTVASVSSETVTEGTDLVHTVTLSGSTPQPVTYPFVLADGSAVAPGDYTNTPVFSNGVTFDSVNGTITVPAGVTDFTVTYPTVTDALDEGDETTTLTVGGESGTGTIQDPADPTVASVSSETVTEGTDLVHTVTLSGSTPQPVTYPFVLADGSAVAPGDYTNTPVFSNGVTFDSVNGTITVPAGVTDFTVTYPTVTDALDEGDETTTLTVGGESGTGTIQDPADPTVASVSSETVTEGTDLVHTVTLSGSTPQPVTYPFVLADGSAVAPGDYTNTPVFSNGVTFDSVNGTITVPAGVTDFTVTYPTVTDALDEGDETTTLTVGGESGTGTIQDPADPTVASVSSETVTEGTDLVHTVTLSGITQQPVTYPFVLADGSAVAPGDYTNTPVFSNGVTFDSVNGTITVPAGVTDFTVTYPTVTDALDEGDETTTLTVGGESGTGTIQDPADPTVASVSSETVTEGTDLVHTVTLSGITQQPVTYPFVLADGSAVAPGDYTNTPVFSNGVTFDSVNGTITVPAGVTDFTVTYPTVTDALDEGDETTTLTVGGESGTGTIQDPADPTVASVSSETVTEGTDLVHTVTLSGITQQPVTYPFVLADGSAVAPGDYTNTPVFSNGVTFDSVNGTITVPAGVTDFTVTYPTVTDALDEGDETTTLTVGGESGTGTIQDPADPTVASVSSETVTEGTDLVHTVTLSGSTPQPVTYPFVLADGSAVAPGDYTNTPVFSNGVTFDSVNGTITVPAGVTDFTVTYPTVTDALDEGDETTTLTVGGESGTGTIQDPADPTVASVSSETVTEGTDLVHTVTLSGSTPQPVTYPFVLADGSAVAPGDYTNTPVFSNGVTFDSVNGTITVPAGVTDFTVTYPTVTDALDEGDETTTLTVGGESGTGTIQDPADPTVASVSSETVTEGTDLVHTVTLSGSTPQPVTYPFVLADGSAVAPGDYTNTPVFSNGVTFDSVNGTITVPAGVTDFTVTYPTVTDALDEGDETTTLTVGGESGTGTIQDPADPTVASVSSETVTEGTDLVHTVTLSGITQQPVTYPFVLADGSAVAPGDYTNTPVFSNGVTFDSVNGTITVPAGVTDFTVTYPTVTDALDEGDETTTLTVGGESGTGTIQDPADPTVASVSSETVTEGTDLVHTVTLSGSTPQPVTYPFVLADGSAVAPGDYTNTPVFSNGVTFDSVNGTITVPAGVTDFTVTYPTVTDALDEGDETTTLTVGGESGTGTIQDPADPTVASVSSETVTEGTDLVHTVTLSGSTPQPVTYPFVLADGSAVAPGDYTNTPVFSNGVTFDSVNGTITVPAGVTDFTVTYPTVTDALDEGDETTTLTVGGESGTGTIQDPADPTVASVSSETVTEGTDLVHTVTLSGSTPQPVTYPFVLADGSAVAPGDYTNTPVFSNGVTFDSVNGTITVPAGVTDFTVTYPTVTDALDEGDETTTLTVGGESGTGTIQDPADPTVASVSSETVTEGTDLVHTVTLSGITQQPVTYPFVLADGSAVAPGDYTNTPVFSNGVTFDSVNGTITVPAGVTDFTVTYPTVTDALDEGDETTTLTVGGESGTGTIQDPADPTVASVSSETVTEGTDLVHTVTLSGITQQPVTYPFVLADGSAVAPGDYTNTPVFSNGVTFDSVNGTITVPAGVTDFTVTYPTVTDALDEGDETTTLTVGGESGTGTIQDPADPTVASVSSETVTEGTDLVHTVTLSGSTPQPVTYPFVLADGSAVAPGDYTNTPVFSNGVTFDSVNGTITVPAGVTDFTVTYPTVTDALDEGDETTTLTVGGESGTGTIQDPADPTVASVSSETVTEGTDLVHTVTLSGSTPQPVTYPFVLADGSAVAPGDYTNTPVFSNGVTFDSVNGTITVPAGVTDFTVTYPTVTDALDEGDETTTLTVGGESGTGTIQDPADPTVASVSSETVTEGTDLVHTITLSGSTPQPVTYPFVLADGSAVAPGDYTNTPVFSNGVTFDSVNGTITVPAGVTDFTVTYPTVTDALDEGDETTTLTVGGESGTGTIQDPADPTVASVSSETVTEGTDLVHTVTLSGSTPQPVTYPFVLADGSAVAPGDYTNTPVFSNGVTFDSVNGTITVPAGVTDFTVTYPTVTDALDEGDETTTLTVGGESGTGTIQDPADPTVASVSSETVTEGTDLVHTVTLSGITQQPVTYPFVLADGSAVAPGDYTNTPVFSNGVTFDSVNGTITVPAGVTDFTVTYPTVTDALDEGDETTTLTVGGESGTGTIQDPADPTVASVSSETVTEGTDLVHTVTLSGSTPQPVTYPFVLADGSAVAPGDYTNTPVFSNGVTFDSVNGTITVPAGVTDFTVTYPTVTDALDEGDETTTLTVGGESGTGTIQDPADPTVASVSSETVTEGTDLVHTVTLSGSTPQPVTYPFVLADGSAVAPGDYTNTPVFSNGVTFDSVNGTITVPAGVTDFTVTYPTVTDALDEGDETTTLTVGGESGTGTIQDPADPTVASVSSETVTEGTDLVHTVTLSGSTPQPVTYPFVLADGSAVAPGDYTNTPVFSNGVTFDSVNGTITVPAGVTDFTVTYPTVTDALDEGDETTTLTVGGESGTGTIQDPVDPSLSVIKTVRVVGIALDDVIEYDIVVTNTGNVTVTNIEIEDLNADAGSIVGSPIASLAPGASVTITANQTITQADIDAGFIENSATATGDSPTGTDDVSDVSDAGDESVETPNGDGTTDGIPDNDPTVTDLTPNASLSVIKTVRVAGIALDDVIEYDIVVTNTGNVTVTNIEIEDLNADAGSIVGSPIASLTPGASVTITANQTITQADIDAGFIENSATATGDSPTGTDDVSDVSDAGDESVETPNGDGTTDGIPDNDPTVTDLTPNASLSVIKTVRVAGIALDDVIEYDIVVTNTGNVTVTNIEIEDLNADAGSIVGSPIASLAPGASVTITANQTITQADIDAGFIENSATATGDSPTGTDDVSDVSDAGDESVETPNGDGTTDGIPDNDPTVTDLTPNASLSVIKTVRVAGIALDDVIEYDIVVTNTGNVTVTNIEIEDLNADAGSIVGSPIASLAPGASVTITANQTITQADIDAGFIENSATATGDSPTGTDDVSDVSDAGDESVETPNGDGTTDGIPDNDPTVTDLTPNASLSVIKTVRVAGIALDDVIEYDIVVTNTGNVTVTNIEIEDLNADAGSIVGSPIASLAPGASVTITANQTITQADIDAGFIENSATATGDSPTGTDDVSDVSDAGDESVETPNGDGTTDGIPDNDPTVTILDVDPDLTLVKTGVASGSNIGDIITYTFTVTNTGNVTVDNIFIDDILTGSTNLTVTPSTLAPGEQGTATATYAISQIDINNGEVINSATVMGEDPDGIGVMDISDSGDETVDEDGDNDPTNDPTITTISQIPNLALTKTGIYVDVNGDELPNVGDEILYTFTVENTGNVDINNIVLTDPLVGIVISGGPIDLTVGEIDTTTFTATYVLTAEDVLSGEVINQAIVTGQDPNGSDVVDISDDPTNTTDIDLDNDGDAEDETVTVIEGVFTDPDDPIIIYTGISPNGDGVNDEFRIVGLRNFPNNTLRIYNRWGVQVFEEDGYEQPGVELFKGISNGRVTISKSNELPVGTYYYVLEYINARGVDTYKAGYLYINR